MVVGLGRSGVLPPRGGAAAPTPRRHPSPTDEGAGFEQLAMTMCQYLASAVDAAALAGPPTRAPRPGSATHSAADGATHSAAARPAASAAPSGSPAEEEQRSPRRKRAAAAPAPPPAARGRPKKRARASAAPGAAAADDGADLVGRAIVVPGRVFKVPSERYRGRVTRRDTRRPGAVDVRFDDGSVYWFPAADVRRWIREEEEQGRAPRGAAAGGAMGGGRGGKPGGARVAAAVAAPLRLASGDALELAAGVLAALSCGAGGGGRGAGE